jgi:hypothetical protein
VREVAEEGAPRVERESHEGENQEEEEEKQALQSKPLRDPHATTAAERAAHEATNLPFRSWCEVCVAGRRDNPAHRCVGNDEDEKGGVPEITMDY